MTGAVNVPALMAILQLLLLDDDVAPAVPPPVPVTLTLAYTNGAAPITPITAVAFVAKLSGASAQRVALYGDDVLLGAANWNGTAWSFDWVPGAVGDVVVIAKSFDANGALLAQSAAVTVSVGTGDPVDPAAPAASLVAVAIDVPHLSNPDAGTLPGSLTVNNSGAATYGIAISVPPGTAGLVPNLQLQYSSQSGNGIAGLGWSVSGLARIHRCGKTIAEDGVNGRIRFDATDRLCLDGQRLVLVNRALTDANYWLPGAEYRTDLDSFARITSQGTGDADLSFTVESKDGRIATFGVAGTTSRVAAIVGNYNSGAGNYVPVSKNGAALAWAVNQVKDRAGNYIKFFYKQDAATGEHLPDTIRYGGNGMGAHAAVHFDYEARSDAWKKYVDEARNDMRSRVSHITTWVAATGGNLDGTVTSGKPVTDYALRYEPSPTSGRSMLDNIELCASNPQTGARECLPGTSFTWGKPDPGKTPGFVSRGTWANGPVLTTHSGAYSAMHPEYFSFNDFENHGRTDVLEQRIASPARVTNVDQGTATLADANPNFFGAMVDHYRYFHNTGSGFTQYTYKLNTAETFVVLSAGDFDGDGVPDLVVQTAAGARICLSPLGNAAALANPANAIVFTCGGIKEALKNDGYSTPYVVDILGNGKSAYYSPFNDQLGYAALCTLDSCVHDPLAPVNAIGLTYAAGNPPIPAHDFVRFQEMVDFSGTGKPQDVRWTKPYFATYTDDGGATVVKQWLNLTPKVTITGFQAPGSAGAADSLVPYAYPALPKPCAPNACPANTAPLGPYFFDQPVGGAGVAADFNGSGYSSLMFGYVEFGVNAVSGVQYTRADTTLCLSTGRALDCGIRQKFSSAAYPRITAVSNFIGDGQASVLVQPLKIDQGGPIPDGTLQMCRLLGDDTTAGTGVADSNMVCDRWSGQLTTPYVYFMDLLGTGRMQMVQYHAGQFVNSAWVEDGRWELFEPQDLAVAGQALDRIYQVKNGMGAMSTVEYVDGQTGGIVTRSGASTLSWPQHVTPQTGKFASRLRTSTGSGNQHIVDYSYQDAAIDVAGRGSLGFARVTAVDHVTALDDGSQSNSKSGTLTTVTAYEQAWPYTGMTRTEVITASDCASYAISSTTNVLVDQRNAQTYGATHFPYIASSTTARHDLDCSDLGTTSVGSAEADGNIAYDTWGNVLKKVDTRVASQETFTTTTANTYYDVNLQPVASGGLVVPLLKRASTTQSQSTDGAARTRTLDYTYVANSYWPLTETVQAGDATLKLSMKLVRAYDRSNNSFGLVGTTTQTWRDSATNADLSRSSGMAFDASGRYPVTVTNAMNDSETRSYDAGTGALTSMAGQNSLVTRWSIDAFGRVTKERRPDGNETRQYRKQCDGACPAGAVMAAISDVFHQTARIAPAQVVYSDDAGHAIETKTWGYDGSMIVADTRYDSMGRLYEADWPHYTQGTQASSAVIARRQMYDMQQRPTLGVSWDEAGKLLSNKTVYAGLATTVTNARTQSRTETRDGRGLIRKVVDANAKSTQFSYEPFGNLSATTDPMGNVISVVYDDLGRKTQLKDPDLGQIDYGVDALGRTVQQVSPLQRARGQATSFEFDKLDRMVTRRETDLESHWIFGTARPNIGRLTGAYTVTNGAHDYDRVETWDALGRPATVTQTLFDGPYTSKVGYDAWGRTLAYTYQRKADAQKAFYLRYNSYGYQSALERAGLALWSATTHDASNRVVLAGLGNGLVQGATYNAHTGNLEGALLRTAGNVIRLQEGYQYDALGSVKLRSQYWDQAGFSESFDYDSLNRLTTSTVTGQVAQSFTYDDAGSLKTKTGVGTYTYPPQGSGAARPHAVQGVTGIAGAFLYDDNGNQTGAGPRAASWSSFDMPLQLTKIVAGVTRSSSFTYGPEHQRTRQTRQDNSNVIYAGAQEVETNPAGQVTVKTYWPQGIGVEIDRPGLATELNWTHKDRLGSPVGITDGNGALREKLAYDAWGKRRSLDGSSTADTIDGVTDDRGFTHHEMLDQLDLVHMNGRVYDPLTARFLSGDPLIQDPLNGQNYNRYSYVLNNPANLTDPTGFEFTECTASRLCQNGGQAVGASLTCEGACSASVQQNSSNNRRNNAGNGKLSSTISSGANKVTGDGVIARTGKNDSTNKSDATDLASIAGATAGAVKAVTTAGSEDPNGSNGRSSNLKGEVGVNMRLEEINSIKGAQVLARNVTIVTESGVRFQADIVWRDPTGGYHFDEVKFGPSSKLTSPQRNGLIEFTDGKWTVAGDRAIEAGLRPGQPLGGIPRTRFVGWELKGYGGADPGKMWEKIQKAWRDGRGSSND